jgi:hypothetical protein
VGLAITKAAEKPGRPSSYVPPYFAGTSVYVRVEPGEGHLVSMDRKACKLEVFSDDRGTELAEGKPGRPWLGPGGARISKDARSCVFEVRSDKLPPKAAACIHVKADVAFRVGHREKTRKTNAALKSDEEFEFGDIPVTVTTIDPPEYGLKKPFIVLRADRDFDAVKEVAFLDADGKAIRHRDNGAAHLGGRLPYAMHFTLDKTPDEVTVEVTYFAEVEELRVSIDERVGLGL